MEKLNYRLEKYLEYERSKDIETLRMAYEKAKTALITEQTESAQKELFDVAEKYFTAFVQSYMDSVVRERNYDSVHTCVGTYLDSPVKRFAVEAALVKDWVSYVWEKCYAIMDEVKAGTRDFPTEESLIEELPKLDW